MITKISPPGHDLPRQVAMAAYQQTATIWAATPGVVVSVEPEAEACASSRLAVPSVDTMAKVSAGATGSGAGVLVVAEAVVTETVRVAMVVAVSFAGSSPDVAVGFGSDAYFFLRLEEGSSSSVDVVDFDSVVTAS